jgi:hypothetical protein
MKSARASTSHQQPNHARRSTRLNAITYNEGHKLAAAAWSPNRVYVGGLGLPVDATAGSRSGPT